MKRFCLLACLIVHLASGCASWNVGAWRLQSPEDTDKKEEKKVSHSRLVGDMAFPFGMNTIRIEGVGLVTNLSGTGCDPAPSPERSALVADMQTRGVELPNRVLASTNGSLVKIQAFLRPGIQKGDKVDVEVRIPSRSDTTSLRGGWLMETRLRVQAVLEDNHLHEGEPLGIAQGAVLVDPLAKGEKDRLRMTRGRVLGGAYSLKSRPVGLALKPESQSVHNATRIETAINKRFHTLQRGIQIGMAKAKKEDYIELKVHPRYKDNIDRYMQVVRAIAVRETASERAERLEQLKKELFDPETCAHAARQLEAIGRDGIETLRSGLKSADPEVRFYSAEALAYLDQREAAEVLAQAAREEPAFRVYALGALSAMEDSAAADQLKLLLSVPSAETRYGAFRAMWSSPRRDQTTADCPSIKAFGYHVLATEGPAMIHVTRSRRAEVVLFGHNQTLQTPLALNAGTQIMINSRGGEEITVSRFAPNEPDQKRLVGCRVDEVIRAIVDLGGNYPDVVQALEEAAATGVLASRFEVDALPEAGRTFDRIADSAKPDAKATGDAKAAKPSPRAKNPMPSLFSGDAPKSSTRGDDDSDEKKPVSKTEEKKGNWFTSMFTHEEKPESYGTKAESAVQ